jgi:peptidoglycan-N-acetylglucosamine deacetylase
VSARRLAIFAIVCLVLAVGWSLRRWVGHARAELVPVIVPQAATDADIFHPSPRAIAQRMALDVHDIFAPPRLPRYAVLTFDDGPYPVATPALLAALQRLRVPADFFLIGRDATEQPAIAARMAAGGNEIGNHTLSHPQMKTLAFQAQLEEIAGGAAAIKRRTGDVPAYFRPPHGNFDGVTLDAVRSNGQTMALWDVDPGDWKRLSPDFIIANVTKTAKSPAVILLHNGSDATVAALPSIVDAYRRAGFEFVTLSELQKRLTLDQINDPIAVEVVAPAPVVPERSSGRS